MHFAFKESENFLSLLLVLRFPPLSLRFQLSHKFTTLAFTDSYLTFFGFFLKDLWVLPLPQHKFHWSLGFVCYGSGTSHTDRNSIKTYTTHPFPSKSRDLCPLKTSEIPEREEDKMGASSFPFAGKQSADFNLFSPFPIGMRKSWES